MSFGEGDYWDIRGTSVFPTKSAIVGILSSCLGYDRNEIEKISSLSDKISVSARQDNQFTTLRDYHTIMDTLKAEGSPNKNAVQSYRQYLMDAEFTILISSIDVMLFTEIKESLIDPVWPIFLGRKSCSPSFPIYWGEEIEVENAELAFRELNLVCKKKEEIGLKDFSSKKKISPQRKYPCITDEKIAGKKALVRDNVVNSRLRIFSGRETTKFYVEVI
jgi:CRISPR-associated protein Cas5/CasD subtype I-E